MKKSIQSPKKLTNRIKYLHNKRKEGKKQSPRGSSLTLKQRLEILKKTNAKCHVCGIHLSKNNFQADHVVSHISGGSNKIDNFLPSCFICNNYRWHYLPEELQLILKLGVWVRTKIEKDNRLGKEVAVGFVKHENRKRKRK